MTDQVEDQEVELDENEIEEAHDPKNAEAQSVASVDKAAKAVKSTAKIPNMGTAKNNMKQDPMPKTKAGMINAAFTKMNSLSKEEMSKVYSSLMAEEAEAKAAAGEVEIIESDYDFEGDLNALVENEATLSDEFKAKTSVIFETAVKTKLAEEINRLEENYKTELEEEVAATKADLVEKVDSYLNYVVENWMEENKVAIHTGLRTEIAEGFMNKLKDVFTESYIEVPESKIDLVDDLAAQVEELEEKLNTTTGQAISVSEELEVMKREAIIREHSKDLAETQVEKLTKLADEVDFIDEETFIEKVKTIKESYFGKVKTSSAEMEELDEDTEASAEVSGSMAQYLAAIKKSNKV